MEQAERELIMRQGVVLPETPRDRREREALDEDLRSLELTGKPVRLRLRNFVPGADTYLAASRGPLAYMLRLREIEKQTAEHEAKLAAAQSRSSSDGERVARRRRGVVVRRGERPDRAPQPLVPGRVGAAMDPRTGDFALVNGRGYKLEPLDADWALARFPP